MSPETLRTPRLTLDRDTARALLEIQVTRGRRIADTQIRSPDGLHRAEAERSHWSSQNCAVLTKLFDTDQIVNGFHTSFARVSAPAGFDQFVGSFRKTVDGEITQLESVLSQLDEYEEPAAEEPPTADIASDTGSGSEAAATVAHICTRFHRVARGLAEREGARNAFICKNDSDLLHLFHALLQLQFDDIRLGEYTPSYARKTTRAHFLLPDEQLAVVVKKTRKGVGPKKVAAQLTADIAYFQKHPDCDKLICFVYDPDGHIKDPRELERDFSSAQSEFGVRVVVTQGE